MTTRPQTRMSPRHMVFAILVASIWGIAFVLSKVGLRSFTPPQLTLLRFTCAAIGVLWLPRPAISWRLLILIGLTLFTGQFLLQFFGIAMGMPAGLTAVVAQAQAPLTVLLAVCVLGDRPSRQQISGMVVALVGLVAISLTLGHGVPLAAFLIMLASALSWSVGNVLVKRIGKVDMLHLMVWASLVPPLPAFILTITLDGGYASILSAITSASWESLAAVVYLGFFATILGYAVWGSLLARYSAAAVAPFALLVPCVGAITSHLVFGEVFEPLRLTGMTMMLIGLLITIVPLNR
ncbi:hypothetical protein hmeg3_02340 [Herbaspirillum sp. meg3]|nr:hypothetical protein hmeg3_02340 [Herbaspirillum sp. meg3]